MERLSWDDYFMQIAVSVAQRGTCDRALVGCLLVRDRRILTTGYNGSLAGLPHCDEVGHLMVGDHCVRSLHAEQNAILQAAVYGISTKGATAYVTRQPCFACSKMLLGAGVVRAVYDASYLDAESLELMAQLGVVLQR